MTEIFKDIKGYEGLYQISNLGSVKALAKIDESGHQRKEKLLKPDVNIKNHTNYHRVTLSKYGETTRKMVHVLVAEHFIDNPEQKPYVNHIDNNGENNQVLNLEWCTHSENMQHSANQARCANIIASDAAKKAAKEQTTKKLIKIFGTIPFTFKTENRRTHITFSCPTCNQSTTVRSDSRTLKHEKIQCGKCNHKQAKIKES